MNIDAKNHVTGRSIYLDDLPLLHGTLYALPFYLPCAHAHEITIELNEARQVPGIVAIYTANDIPGQNQIGGIIPDEPLFGSSEVHYWGQPLGIIIGTSEYLCRQARQLIQYKFQSLPVVIDPREAASKGSLIIPPRTFSIGNVDSVWDTCAYVIEGRADVNGQEHLYIETQGAYAWPKEDGAIFVASSTQGPTAVQRTIAQVLDIPMHKIEVNVVRLGGGFGGKEDQATSWAVMVALAAQILKRPVKMVLHRMDDMVMTGKRHPYSSDFKIGLSKELKILAYRVYHYQNAGAAADLSPAVLERTLFHSTNAYFIPHVEATGFSCRTNLPPNTAFRGFGGPQGKFVIESAITKAAEVIGVKPALIQYRNLLQEGDEMPYGQIMRSVNAQSTWNQCFSNYDLEQKQLEVDRYNTQHSRFKKGFAVQPICFGISFTNTQMNHARALVHIYSDGSIVVSTGAVEMGQGVNTKMLQVVQGVFGVTTEKIRLESTNTLRIANTSPTAASAGADLNGKALEMACTRLYERLLQAGKEATGVSDAKIADGQFLSSRGEILLNWNQLVTVALSQRVNLSEHAHYSTPEIYFDKKAEKGHPFAYHVYGTAAIFVTIDGLRGTYQVDEVHIVHDFGNSMNWHIDLGQVEGAFVQGMGWMTMEEILYDKSGKLISNALSTYKVPDLYSVPKTVNVQPLRCEGPELAIKKSKAVGEPPLMYGLGVYFALRDAIQQFNSYSNSLAFDAPMTPEKVLDQLYSMSEITSVKN